MLAFSVPLDILQDLHHPCPKTKYETNVNQPSVFSISSFVPYSLERMVDQNFSLV